MRKLPRLALAASFAGVLAAPALAEDGVTATEIVIGNHTALSGPVSAWGIGSTEGMRMRFEEANEKGIHGRKIKFVVEDHQYQTPRAVQAANKLINNDKIFAMVGALGTPQNNAVLGEQLQKGVPNLFPFTAARSMAEPFHKLKFAAFSTYYDQVRAVAKHFVEKEGKKKICTMYQDTDFGHEIRDGVREQAKAMKLEVAGEAAYGPMDTEFVAPVTKLKSAGCDLVILGSIIRDSIQAVGTAKKLGWADVTFVGQAASYDPIVAAAPGGIMEGFFSATGMPYAYADTSAEPIKAWAAKYKSRTSQDPNSAAQYGYVTADIVVKALEAAGQDLTRAKLVAALEGTKNYKPHVPRARHQLRPRQAPRLDRLLPGQGGRRPLEGGRREPALLIKTTRTRWCGRLRPPIFFGSAYGLDMENSLNSVIALVDRQPTRTRRIVHEPDTGFYQGSVWGQTPCHDGRGARRQRRRKGSDPIDHGSDPIQSWLTPEGIAVKRAYTAADTAGLDFLDGYPGIAPYLRGPYPTMYVHAALDHPPVRRLLHRRGLQRVLPPQPRRRAEGPVGRLRPRHPPRLRLRSPARAPATSAWPASPSTRSSTCGCCSTASRSTR